MSRIWEDSADRLWEDFVDREWEDNLFTKVATPIILPSAGAYKPEQLITITCATSGASIYYTIDESTPDSGDILYSIPFALESAKTIKAIGIKSGDADSDIASVVYTILSWEGFDPYCPSNTNDPYTDCDTCISFDPDNPFDLVALTECDPCPSFDPDNPFDLSVIADPYLSCSTIPIVDGCLPPLPLPQANLYGTTSDFMYGAYFDGETLTSLGSVAISNDNHRGIIIYEGNVLTVTGFETNARLVLIDSEAMTIISTIDPSFGANDVHPGSDGNLLNGALSNIIYFTDGRGGSCIEITDLVKTGGSDSLATSTNLNQIGSQFHNDKIYMTQYKTPTTRIDRIDTGTMIRDYTVSASPRFPRRFTIYNNFLYTVEGTFSSDLSVFDLNGIFQFENQTPTGQFGDVAEVGGFIVVCTEQNGGSPAGLWKFRASDGLFLTSLTGTSHDYNRISKINDQFLLAWNGRNMAVYDILSMIQIDTIATSINDDGNACIAKIL